jgi:membrane protease YdiL (CAAX protease family)
MVIQLGADPWILILIMALELLFIFIPALIASRIEKQTFFEELRDMGFHKNEDSISKNVYKVLFGIGIGMLFFLIGGFIILFFKYVVENLFGAEFVREGERGAISTSPIQPSLLQIIIIIILQVLLVGLCEEAFFRGFLLNKLESKLKMVYCIFISSLCFAFYHVPPFLVPFKTIITYFGYYFTFGILLSLVFWLFDSSLIPCIIAHSFFNILIILSILII